ncbi:hypothetical protein [Dactylosporangium sp. CA-139066]|uniref:hypothetical protein n=1 Tax=Dactylosporangium sp. CA-139066 TaxID=3239930 RepID=UPI003D8D4BD2
MRKLLTSAVAAVSAVGALAIAGPAAQAAASACVGTIQITSFGFNPAQVTPGQSSTATVVARNCTARSQQVSVMTVARFVGATTGIPAGCPVIDPLPPARVTIAPRASYSSSTTYVVFAGCTATALEATVRITDSTSGTLLATQTARLTINQPAPPPAPR